MTYGTSKKKLKRVSVEFEYTTFSDLRQVLARLSDLITQGNESYFEKLKCAENEEKEHEIKLVQKYVNTEREYSEREINGKLKLVIKSKI